MKKIEKKETPVALIIILIVIGIVVGWFAGQWFTSLEEQSITVVKDII